MKNNKGKRTRFIDKKNHLCYNFMDIMGYYALAKKGRIK